MSVDTLENYELDGLLGEGGIGQVYAALDKVLGRRVAIKALRPELSRDRSFVERFYNEAKSLANLNHTNITTLYALHVEDSDAFMVMELVQGQTLEALLARVGRLTLRDSLAILAQAVPGMRYAHRRGIIHRDLKPANLMLTDDGVVKIMDFGIARVHGSEHLTRVGEFCGTFVYASPEQIRGEDVDERSDLYSLAIVLYRMLAGTPPFTSTNEYALMTAQLQTPPPPLTGQVPELDAATEAALMRALAKRREDRFASVEEFGRAVGAMSIRGESVDILQQLYDHAFAAEDPEATRIVGSTRPPIADPTMPSKPARSTAEWQLPPSLSGRETSVRPPESRPSGRRQVLAETKLRVPGAADKGGRPLSRRWPVAAALITPLLLGGGYLAVLQGVPPGLSSSLEPRPGAAANEPRTAAPPVPPPELGSRQTPSTSPSQVAKNELSPPAPLPSAKNEPPAVPPPAPAETANAQPLLSPTRVDPPRSEPPPAAAPPAPDEAASVQAVPPSPSPVETAKVQPSPPSPPPPVTQPGAPSSPPVGTAKSELSAAQPVMHAEEEKPQAALTSPPAAPAAAESNQAASPPSAEQVPVDSSKAQAPPPPSPVGTATNEASPPKQVDTPPPVTPPAKPNGDRPQPGTPANPASATTDGTQSPPSPSPAEPMVVAKAEPAPSPEPSAPLGPQATADRPKPEGEPDLQGKVTGAKRLDEIEIAAKWIKIYGIVDRARGAQEAQHVKALVGYLKPSRNHLVCYRKAADTYRCYSDGQDIARLALQDGMVDLAPNAPSEYRSLLSGRR